MDQLVEEMHNGLKLFHEGPSYFYATAFSRDTGGSRLMQISLVRISLLRFFKTFHKYLLYANFGLIISLVQFFGQNICTANPNPVRLTGNSL